MLGVFSYTPIPVAAADDFPHVVKFELGDTEFAPGDHIEITEVRGTAAALSINQTYSVSGKYTLSSSDEAELALFVTLRDSTPSKVDHKQRVRITKGSGTFRLDKTMDAEGYPHVSFYPVPSGSSFGGVYFGTGQWLLRRQGSGSPGAEAASSGPNQAILNFLGDPVPAPPNLDPAYSAGAIQRALMSAAAKSGVAINSVQIDNSEFPPLLGVVSTGDFDLLGEEIKKTKDYDFTGSVGHKTHHAFNIVPYRAFPPESSQRIGRRLTVRYQMLYEKISGIDGH